MSSSAITDAIDPRPLLPELASGFLSECQNDRAVFSTVWAMCASWDQEALILREVDTMFPGRHVSQVSEPLCS